MIEMFGITAIITLLLFVFGFGLIFYLLLFKWNNIVEETEYMFGRYN